VLLASGVAIVIIATVALARDEAASIEAETEHDPAVAEDALAARDALPHGTSPAASDGSQTAR
jgi:hypothetical protein